MGERRQAQIDRALDSWNPVARKMQPEDERRILQLLAAGGSYRSIGRLTGFSYTTVGNVAARNHRALAHSG
jgi:DNA invertase Pin-like site-specific DNA recombinase